jgi:RNA processing factor Prp31
MTSDELKIKLSKIIEKANKLLEQNKILMSNEILPDIDSELGLVCEEREPWYYKAKEP